MAHIIADRVKESTVTTGTGQLTLDGAATGFVSFNDKMANNDTCYYCIDGGSQWEVGLGTYADTNLLTRTSVLSNSLGTTALVSFSAGTKSVFMTHPAASLQRVKSGSFSATISGTTTAGSCTYTYGNSATYVRVGDIVFVTTTEVYYTGHTGTGNIKLGGLPYKTKEWTECVVPVKLRDIIFSNLPFGVIPSQSGGGNEIYLKTNVSNADNGSVAMDAAGVFAYSFSYITSDPF